jgi:hypothetical protein
MNQIQRNMKAVSRKLPIAAAFRLVVPSCHKPSQSQRATCTGGFLMTRGLVLLVWIVVGTWASSSLAQDATEKAFPHDTTLSDLAPLKLAIRKHLAISMEPTVFIAMARMGESRVVYICGLTDGGSVSTSILFFAKRTEGAVEVEEIDSDSKVDGRAKKLCDAHGFRTPIPGRLSKTL